MMAITSETFPAILVARSAIMPMNAISVSQEGELVAMDAKDARAVAAELVRLADEIEKEMRHENP